MRNCNKKNIQDFIAQLLHPKINVDTSNFPASQSFWNHLVKIGSSQLILPSIYSALKFKKLEHHVPKDLISYLEKISNLNHKRNISILKQITFLSNFFKKNNIDYVFVKGAALLILKPYKVEWQRMIGDIDLLVAEKDLQSAQQLLLNIGFEPVSNEFSFTNGVFRDDYKKHLQRIVHQDFIAAVEIHKHLLVKKNHLITSKDVLKNKVELVDGFCIPSNYHLWKHAILNWQYNDNGMRLNSLSFRTVVDVLYLEPRHSMKKIKTSGYAIKHFYSLLSLFYRHYPVYFYEKKIFYRLQLQFWTFNKLFILFTKLKSFFLIGFHRIVIFSYSKIYRKRILNNPRLFIERIIKFWY